MQKAIPNCLRQRDVKIVASGHPGKGSQVIAKMVANRLGDDFGIAASTKLVSGLQVQVRLLGLEGNPFSLIENTAKTIL